MKKFFFPFTFLLFLTVLTKGQGKEEKAVAAAVERFNKAMISADEIQLNNIVAEQLNYGHSSGVVQDKAAFVDDVVHGPFNFVTIDISDQIITMAGETAVVRHVLSSAATNNGNPTNIRIGNVLIWQKQKGQWKLLARQAFKI